MQKTGLEPEIAQQFPHFNPDAKFYRVYKRVVIIPIDDAIRTKTEVNKPIFETESALSVFESQEFEKEILRRFSGIHRKVIELVFQGKNMNQISHVLKLTTAQAYHIRHQIAIELNEMKTHHEKKRLTFMRKVVFFYLLTHPKTSAKELYDSWHENPCTKEYRRPPYNVIDDEVSNFVEVFRKR